MALHSNLTGADVHETKLTIVPAANVPTTTPSAAGVLIVDSSNVLWKANSTTTGDWTTPTAAGSGTPPAGSNGNIQFNSSSAFGADANLNWDAAHESIVIGGIPSSLTSPIPSVEATSDSGSAMLATTYSSSGHSNFVGLRAGGTHSSPTATPTTSKLVTFAGIGHDGSAFDFSHAGGEMHFVSSELWTPTAHGTTWFLDMCPNGTTATVNVLYADAENGGQLGIGRAPGTEADAPHGLVVSAGAAIVDDGTGNGIVRVISYGGSSSSFVAYAANGTELAPTASLNGDLLGFHGAKGHDGTSFTTHGSRAAVSMLADEDWTPTAQGTRLIFRVTGNGTTANNNAVQIINSGYMSIGAGGAPVSRLSVGTASAFQVNDSGNILSINGVPMTWPSAHGTAGYVLSDSDGAGTLTWVAQTGGGGGTPGGATGNIQFNSSGAFAGDFKLNWDDTNSQLQVSGHSSGAFTNGAIVSFVNNGAGTYSAPSGAILGDAVLLGYGAGNMYLAVADNFGTRSAMAIKSTSGVTKIGMGTTIPSTTLHVAQTGIVTPVLTLDTDNVIGNAWLSFFCNNTTTTYATFQAQSNCLELAMLTGANFGFTLPGGGGVGVGNTAPASMFSVGASSQFQVDSNGDIVKLRNVPVTFPSAHGATGSFLNDSDGNGTLTWTSGLVWDATNTSLVIGGFPANLPGPLPSVSVEADQNAAAFVSTMYKNSGDAPLFIGARAGGTQASPLATPSGVKIAALSGIGYDGSAFDYTNSGAEVDFVTNETWSPSAHGTDIIFKATTSGTVGLAPVLYATASPSARLGIGASPAYALDVTGDANVSTGSTYRINGSTILPSTQTDYSTSGRVVGTVYQNTSKNPLYIFISASTSVAATAKVISDASATPSVAIARFDTGGAGKGNMSAIVLPGNYYQVTVSTGTLTPSSSAGWIETV